MSTEGTHMTGTTEINTTQTHPSGEYPSVPEITKEEPKLTRGSWIGMAVVAIIVAAVVVFGILARRGSERTLEKETVASAIPSVNVIYPTSSTLSSEIALPGNTQAYMDTPIYSRTNGYLKSWYFDIGRHVRKGQLMAQIETPEVDQQLQVAQADLKSAEANLDLANTTSTRYQNLLKTNSVSKQETDVAMSDASAKKGLIVENRKEDTKADRGGKRQNDDGERVPHDLGQAGIGQQIDVVIEPDEALGRRQQVIALEGIPERQHQRYDHPNEQQANGRRHQRPGAHAALLLEPAALHARRRRGVSLDFHL